jgi:hypothetical protein
MFSSFRLALNFSCIVCTSAGRYSSADYMVQHLGQEKSTRTSFFFLDARQLPWQITDTQSINQPATQPRSKQMSDVTYLVPHRVNDELRNVVTVHDDGSATVAEQRRSDVGGKWSQRMIAGVPVQPKQQAANPAISRDALIAQLVRLGGVLQEAAR